MGVDLGVYAEISSLPSTATHWLLLPPHHVITAAGWVIHHLHGLELVSSVSQTKSTAFHECLQVSAVYWRLILIVSLE